MLQKARYKGLSVSKLEEVIGKTEKGLEDYKAIYDTIFDENMENSSDYLGKVREFMTTFGQPVHYVPTELPDDREELRISLMYEELKEYAIASGKLDFFEQLGHNTSVEYWNNYTNKRVEYVPIIDQVEQLDALLDLQYVLSGTVHEHGFGEIFNPGFDEVHDSNMSKACPDESTALRTIDKYAEEGVEVHCDTSSTPIVIYRKEDNKVLKSIDYKPAQLAQFLK